MKAIWFEVTGDTQVLNYGERPTPKPARGEVLVQLYSSAVNPSDIKKRSGAQDPGLERGFVIPHSDGAGIITAVGEGVDAARVGERVWVYQAQYQRHLGTAAQYVAVAAARAVALPANTSFAHGACLGIPAMTAHRCLFADAPIAGKTILIHGAGGRVGFYAAQIAKLNGARVIGSVGDREKIKSVERFCDLVINYNDDNWVEAVLDFSDGVDKIVEVEFGLNVACATKIIKANGVIAAYASMQNPKPQIPFYELMFKNITLRLVLVYGMPEDAKTQAEQDINKMLAEAKLHHRIGATHALKDCADAHQRLEGGVDGCVVLEIAHD